jgi:hypothetical protein
VRSLHRARRVGLLSLLRKLSSAFKKNAQETGAQIESAFADLPRCLLLARVGSPALRRACRLLGGDRTTSARSELYRFWTHFRHQPPSDGILASVSYGSHCQMFQSELPKHPGTSARGYPTVGCGYSWGRVPCVVGVTEVGRGYVRDVAGCCRPSPSAC